MVENPFPPTIRDIAHSCGISSTSVVDYNLRILEREGYISRTADVSRGIRLIKVPETPSEVRLHSSRASKFNSTTNENNLDAVQGIQHLQPFAADLSVKTTGTIC